MEIKNYNIFLKKNLINFRIFNKNWSIRVEKLSKFNVKKKLDEKFKNSPLKEILNFFNQEFDEFKCSKKIR